MGVDSTYSDRDEIEALSAERLTAWQTDRLREVADHAHRHVPFYRDLWAGTGIGTNALLSIKDFERFPMVTKRDLVKAGDRWINPRQGRVAFSTRGTSGDPLLVLAERRGGRGVHRPHDARFSMGGISAGNNCPADESGLAPPRCVRSARGCAAGRALRVLLGQHGRGVP